VFNRQFYCKNSYRSRRKFLQILSDEVVDVAGDASEDSRQPGHAATMAAEGGDADLCVKALIVFRDQRTATVTLKI
jgi:hypothetical protein